VGSLLDPIYRAVESGDPESVASLLRPDVFMFTPEAGGVLLSRDAVVSAMSDQLRLVRASPGGLRLEAEQMASGSDQTGRTAWVFDTVTVHLGEPAVALPTRVRVTALLARGDDGWQVAACYWSLPFGTQAEQDEVKHAGLLEPGVTLPEADDSPTPPYADDLVRALDEPRLLPLRGPARGAQVTEDVGWLAANIDIGQPPTPYRFFYVWIREGGQWQILISHDAVSRPLAARAMPGRNP